MIPDIDELISVIVPAYNGERFIAETLVSVLCQSHKNLEVIVVDDGSRDSTQQIVRDFAKRDSRIRLVSQQNAGVAHARNLGLREAQGRFVAPCDADDLWSPDKLSRQVAAWREAGDSVGLVYTGYAVIDANNIVSSLAPFEVQRGNVFGELCKSNFIANASSAMMRRDDMLSFGGFDPGLRAQGAQGCEDIKLYLQIASIRAFEVIEARSVGYRQTDDNMSSDIFQMLRSFNAVAAELSVTYPDKKEILDEGKVWLMRYLRNRAVASRNYGQALKMSSQMFQRNPVLTLKTVRWDFVVPAADKAQRMLKGLPPAEPDAALGRPFLGKQAEQPFWVYPDGYDGLVGEVSTRPA